MKNPESIPAKWHKRFFDLAQLIASWSKDPSTKVGAVIVDELRRVVGHGYNGFPRGVDDGEEIYANRALKLEMVVHAEVNAILNASKDVRGAYLYCTFFPCPQCAAKIIQAGIAKVYYRPNDSDSRYVEKKEIAMTMLAQAGIPTYEISE